MVHQAVHRSGPLKQSNKAHKSGPKKKKDDRGRTEVKSLTHAKKLNLNRRDRKNRAQQLRKNKREEVLTKKRSGSLPILVGIIPLSSSQDPNQLLERIKACDEELLLSESKKGHCHISSSRLKQRFTFVYPQIGNIHDVLDIAKVADVLLFIHTLDDLDDYVEMLLSSILSHALPTAIHVTMSSDGLNFEKKSDVKRAILKKMAARFSNEKLYHADARQDLLVLLRIISTHKRRSVAFRDARSHLLAEHVEFVPGASQEASAGTLKVSGYVRGQPLNVNGLVHIPGWGDFQMSQIDYISDPHPLRLRKNRAAKSEKSGASMDEDMSDETVLVVKADPAQQESLQSEIIPDPMEGEQTWPTEEELEEAALPKSVVKTVAEGTATYQASWILDSDSEDDSSGSEDDDVKSEMQDDDMKSEMSDDDEPQDFNVDDDRETVADSENGNKYDDVLDMDEEKKTLVRFREERMEQMFPDERDTPADVPARIRYQKYRGLINFTQATWDPMEDLPPEYARIYRFENFKQIKKKVLNSVKDGALPGMYVTVHISNVPASLYDAVESSPVVVYGLLPHEQKMSCINVFMRKHPSCTEPIKSKDRLIFHIGFRRFMCQPLFSEHSIGNKHKFEKFLPNDSCSVATFVAPIMFPPCSAVVFRQKPDGTHQLAAVGNVLNVDPDRLVIKRVVLSGHPFKIMKNSIVVRYMFFNREDIMWFKPIQLSTKYGRKGAIKEPLGTHGHMKCVFDKQLKSEDVVFMRLYKRVFPKMTYDPCVPTPFSPYDSMDMAML